MCHQTLLFPTTWHRLIEEDVPKAPASGSPPGQLLIQGWAKQSKGTGGGHGSSGVNMRSSWTNWAKTV